MPKLTSIVLICLFALSQYAKQLSYIECRISNTFKADAVKCDCETKLVQDNPSSPEDPVGLVHFHVHIDDVFFLNDNPDIAAWKLIGMQLNSRYLSCESEGNTKPPSQPPRS
ncbi:MAG: hypothetical protein WBP16_14640 [Ferruginibacter sp.]